MAYSTVLEINGYSPPQPDKGSFAIGVQKIWSENTKRTASAKMVGDIKALKTTLDMAWQELNQAQLKSLDNAVSNISKPFFSVKYVDQKGNEKTKNFYADSMTYNRKVYRNGTIYYSDVSLSLVEQ